MRKLDLRIAPNRAKRGGGRMASGGITVLRAG